jgi:hypothetical protein
LSQKLGKSRRTELFRRRSCFRRGEPEIAALTMKRRNLTGRRARRTAYALATALAASALASPLLAAAQADGNGAVLESLAPSRGDSRNYWTKERIESAEPLPVVTLPGSAPVEPGTTPETLSAEGGGGTEIGEAGEGTETAETGKAASTAAVAGPFANTSALEGTEVTAAESNLPPNSANGKLVGTFETEIGNNQVLVKKYVCSAAVVNSPAGNVIVSAGHCGIDPETGIKTSEKLIFIPGYRNNSDPFGKWSVEYLITPEAWKSTALPGVRANEGSDLAFFRLKKNKQEESVQQAVGALGINFDQACNQSYTQFGYPAEAPYTGELLYSRTSPYAGADSASGFVPVPMKIGTDFTRGASGGPWTVGAGAAQTVLSVTAYGYESQPGYLYGPYFGEAAKAAYNIAIGKVLPAGIEESCTPLPPVPSETAPTGTTTPPSPAPTQPVTPTPKPETKTPAKEREVTLKVKQVRRRANGSAVLTAQVNTAGMLKLSGTAVRAESLDTPSAGQYKLVVAPKGSINRKLRQKGKAKVGVKVAFVASGKTKAVSRSIQLSRHAAAPAQR